MCGIFGAILGAKSQKLQLNLKSIVKDLLLKSEIRGQDSAGVAVAKEDKIRVVKYPLSPSEYIYNSEFNELFTNQDRIGLIIGHARMQTDGSFRKHHNNQPIVKDGIVFSKKCLILLIINTFRIFQLENYLRNIITK